MSKKKNIKKRINRFPLSFWKQHIIPAILLAVAAFGLYAYSMTFEYVLDDQVVFTKNEFVKKGFAGISDILSKESFQGYFGEQKDLVEGGRYRPLSLISFAMEYQFFGANQAVSHFINVLLYALTSLLLFRVMFLLFPRKADENYRWYWNIPFLATLLFVLHPIHTEVIANVKGRDEIMCLIGSLAALYYAFKYVDTDKIIWAIISGICLFLGLFGKENAITFVGVIPITLYFFNKKSFSKIALATIPLLASFVLWFIIRWNVLGFALTSGTEVVDLMNNPFQGMSIGEKFATIFYTLGIYVKLLFLPHPLTHDYYPYHIPIMQWSNIASILSLLLYVAMGIFSLWGLRTKNVFAYAIIFYLATLSITSNVPFTVGTFMNERFVYISSLGFCIALAYLVYHKIPQWLPKPTANYIAFAIAGLYIIGFTAKTISRVPAWETPFTLNSAAIKVSKNSARANVFMGTAFFEKYKIEKDNAVKQELLKNVSFHINKALEIHSRYGSALTMKSGVLAEEYKFDRDLDKLLAGFGDLIKVKYNLSYIDQYMKYLNSRADASKLINWYYHIGTYFKDNLQRNDLAAKYFKMGLEVDANNPQLRQALQLVQ